MVCKIFLKLEGGAKMPALGYGTWQSKDAESLEKSLEVALEAGYRHIDTAQAYQNEQVIGKVLKRWFDSGKLKREDVFITTKLSPFGMTAEKVEDCIKESLEKLQLVYVDLYLMHLPVSFLNENGEFKGDPNVHFLDVWDKMEEQYFAGRTKALGISNFNQSQIERVLDACRVKPANLQIEMHVYHQQKEMAAFCKQKDITIVAYAPIGSGGYNNFTADTFGLPPKELPDTLKNPVVLAIAKKHKKTSAQVLLRFLLQSGVAAIPKSLTPSRIQENFNVANFFLDTDDVNKLRGLDTGHRIFNFSEFGKFVDHPEYPFKGVN